ISYVDSSGGGPNLAFRHIYWCDYSKIAASHPNDIACRDNDSAAYIKVKDSKEIFSVGDKRQYTPGLEKLIVSSHQGGKCQVIQVDIDSCKDGKNGYVIYANAECPETPLPCPTSLNAVCNANGTATFSWTAVTDAVAYTLRANKDPYDVWHPVLAPSDGTDDFAAGPTTYRPFTNPLVRGVNWQWSIHPVKKGEVYSPWQPNVCYAPILNCPGPTPTPYMTVRFKSPSGQDVSHLVGRASWDCPRNAATARDLNTETTAVYIRDPLLSHTCTGVLIGPMSSNEVYRGVTPSHSTDFDTWDRWFGWRHWYTGHREMTIIIASPTQTPTEIPTATVTSVPPTAVPTEVPTATPNPTAIPTTVLSVCSGLIIDNVTTGEKNVSSIKLTDTIKITINFTETTQVDAVAIRLLVLGQTIATMVDERNSTGQVEGTWGTNNWIYTGVLGQAIGSGEGQVDIYAFIKTNGVWK
ncbi:hypothetical protein KKA69_04290, partial [Patescibacteria group bacterium]|nr:hypothetical protein [Patescibacteria group bacterium]